MEKNLCDYSASFWTSNFRFAHGRDRKPSFPWFRDFRTCPWLPKPILSIFGDTRMPQLIQEKPDTFLKHIMWGNLKMLKIMFCIFRKGRGTEKSWRPVLKLLENLEYGINIFQKAWEGMLVIWDQYLPTKHEMIF